MILLVDPDISYLEKAKKALEALRFGVLIAEEQRELIRLCFDFKDEIGVIAFDSSRIEMDRGLMNGIEYALRHADINETHLIEWNFYDWKENRNVSLPKPRIKSGPPSKNTSDCRTL